MSKSFNKLCTYIIMFLSFFNTSYARQTSCYSYRGGALKAYRPVFIPSFFLYGLISLFLLLPITSSVQAQTNKTDTSRQLPYFASLKADKVNVREGPSQEHRISWVFKRLGLPVEITASHELWHKIRDSSGAEGWVFHRLVSRKRTALTTPWENKARKTGLYVAKDLKSRKIANMEKNVLVYLKSCDGKWCTVHVDKLSGWVPQNKIWGAYKGEIFKNE